MNLLKTALKIFAGRDFGAPLYLIFFVTSACNARCRHCFYSDRLNQSLGKELTLKEIDRMTRSMGSLFTVNLTGGEPFLREDLADIARLFYQNTRIRTLGLVTNGLLTERIGRTVKQILEECPGLAVDISISLDALGENHDRLRGVPGIFDAAVGTARLMKKFKSSNLAVGISMAVTRENQNDLTDIYRFAKFELGVDYVAPLLLRGKIPEPAFREIDIAKYDELVSAIEQDSFGQDQGSLISRLVAARDRVARREAKRFRAKKVDVVCFAGAMTGVVNEVGEVFPCELMAHPIGKLRDKDYDFRRIWNSHEKQVVCREIRKSRCFCTHECFFNANIFFNKKFWPDIWQEFIKTKGSH